MSSATLKAGLVHRKRVVLEVSCTLDVVSAQSRMNQLRLMLASDKVWNRTEIVSCVAEICQVEQHSFLGVKRLRRRPSCTKKAASAHGHDCSLGCLGCVLRFVWTLCVWFRPVHPSCSNGSVRDASGRCCKCAHANGCCALESSWHRCAFCTQCQVTAFVALEQESSQWRGFWLIPRFAGLFEVSYLLATWLSSCVELRSSMA
eukprot:6325172-Amphidinium_carterae.1